MSARDRDPLGIVDLGSLGRDQGGEEGGGPVLAQVRGSVHYVNDFQPSLDPGGAMMIKFFYRTDQGVNEPVSIAMPIGLFLALCETGPAIEAHMAKLMAQAQGGAATASSAAAAQQARDAAQ